MKSAAGYRIRDYFLQQSVHWLSHLIGVRNLSRPFWNRWRASLLGDETIMRFLGKIEDFDDWTNCAERMVEEEEAALQADLPRLDKDERVARLRRLSFLCHMGQWGSISVDDERRSLYRRSRDYYVEAETLAFGPRFRRAAIEWKGDRYWANIHYPEGDPPFAGALILHGMDDTKEEHLVTELRAVEGGAAVCSIDGPGQGESFILGAQCWPDDFDDFVHAVIAQLGELDFDLDRLGLVGISWGGFWIYKVAARDQRIRGLYDLGGPTRWKDWYPTLPYFLKLRYAQILKVETKEDIAAHDPAFSFSGELQQIRCPVRIVHGGKDPVVPLSDKEKQIKTLREAGTEVLPLIFPNGDHCCTGEAATVRRDASEFFGKVLFDRPPASPSRDGALSG
jgi:pimeloyl-ACP methyl ester carboxylesterase